MISGFDSIRAANNPEFEPVSGRSAQEHVAVRRSFLHLL